MLKHAEIVLERLEAMNEYAAHLERFRAMPKEEFLSDIEHVWAAEHGLQLAIQCVIDICDRLVADLGLGAPPTHVAAVERLCRAGVLPPTLQPTLDAMIRFRNILVHAYLRVNTDLVYQHLQNRLPDFAQFAAAVLRFLHQTTAPSF